MRKLTAVDFITIIQTVEVSITYQVFVNASSSFKTLIFAGFAFCKEDNGMCMMMIIIII